MSKGYFFAGDFGNEKFIVKVRLDIISFEEEGTRICYSPALDLSGYGVDEEKAKKSFEVSLKEFLRYTTNNNTLIEELKKLEWEVKGRKNNRIFKLPYLDQLFQNREYLSDIVRNKNFSRTTREVGIPAMA
jgi:hypothetical protein